MQDELTIRVAKRLQELRLEKKWSLEKLASLSGVSRATLSRLENVEVSPTTAVIGKLCAAFGISVSGFVAYVDEDAGGGALIKVSEQILFQDKEVGFVRKAISTSSPSVTGEVVEVELEKSSILKYDKPLIYGQQHHLVMTSGYLELTVNDKLYKLDDGDCLRYRNFGATEFRTFEKGGATFFMFLI